MGVDAIFVQRGILLEMEEDLSYLQSRLSWLAANPDLDEDWDIAVLGCEEQIAAQTKRVKGQKVLVDSVQYKFSDIWGKVRADLISLQDQIRTKKARIAAEERQAKVDAEYLRQCEAEENERKAQKEAARLERERLAQIETARAEREAEKARITAEQRERCEAKRCRILAPAPAPVAEPEKVGPLATPLAKAIDEASGRIFDLAMAMEQARKEIRRLQAAAAKACPAESVQKAFSNALTAARENLRRIEAEWSGMIDAEASLRRQFNLANRNEVREIRRPVHRSMKWTGGRN
jgi:hypothetical protein